MKQTGGIVGGATGLVMGLLLTSAALAGPAEVEAIAAGCQKSTNWTPGACACIAAKAGDLDSLEQSFLAAMLNEDQAKIVEIRLQMSIAQMQRAALFMANSGPACQGQ